MSCACKGWWVEFSFYWQWPTIYVPLTMDIQNHFTIYSSLAAMRRQPTMDIENFVDAFDYQYQQFLRVHGPLQETIAAYMLLSACDMSEDDEQRVINQIGDNKSYNAIVTVLRSTFGKRSQGWWD